MREVRNRTNASLLKTKISQIESVLGKIQSQATALNDHLFERGPPRASAESSSPSSSLSEGIHVYPLTMGTCTRVRSG